VTFQFLQQGAPPPQTSASHVRCKKHLQRKIFSLAPRRANYLCYSILCPVHFTLKCILCKMSSKLLTKFWGYYFKIQLIDFRWDIIYHVQENEVFKWWDLTKQGYPRCPLWIFKILNVLWLNNFPWSSFHSLNIIHLYILGTVLGFQVNKKTI
jgi:hypothetical protein